MEDSWLYYTAVPVLLGSARPAGALARRMWNDHRLTPHWFGSGLSPTAHTYTVRHRLRLSSLSDGLILDALRSFAVQPDNAGRLLVLIPVSDDAGAFIDRTKGELESLFVLLPRPVPHTDPLAGLLWTSGPTPTQPR